MDIGSRPVHIVVDDREQAGDVPAALAARGDAAVEVARLKVGDYHIERRVLVERKTAADFAASLIDGRLFRQASRPRRRAGSRRAAARRGRDGLAGDGRPARGAPGGADHDRGLLWSGAPVVRRPRGERAIIGVPRPADPAVRSWRTAAPGVSPKGQASAAAFSCRACPASGRSARRGCWSDSAPSGPS